MKKGMTSGKTLKYLEKSALRYCAGALASLRRNRRRIGSKLTEDDIHQMRSEPQFFQRIIDAVLTDFINHVGLEQCINRGEIVEHIKIWRA